MPPRKIGYEDTDLMFLENVDDLLVFGSVFLHFGTSQGLLYFIGKSHLAHGLVIGGNINFPFLVSHPLRVF